MEQRERQRRTRWLGVVVLGLAVAAFPFLRTAEAATVAKRVSGADRYATAAEVSEDAFAPGVPVAFLATGQNFPDALAGAAAAGKGGGPVLLTQPTSLPSATANELDRLNPGKIVVLGGTSAVSQSVFDQLDPYTDGTVTRITGNDRYETAANLSAATFPVPAVGAVYVATGLNFPDALAGGPAAANAPGLGGPIVLVQTSSIPTATATELDRLNPGEIVVLGGTSAVSQTVVDQLDTYTDGTVSRVSGADRYLTAVEISKDSFASGADTVYLATGENFPDALAAGAPAGVAHGPVLLAQSTCIPKAVNDEITRLDPDDLIIVGGTSALSDAVLNRTECTAQASSTGPSLPPGFTLPPDFTLPTNFPTAP
jgi:putative cell wall-binding protein